MDIGGASMETLGAEAGAEEPKAKPAALLRDDGPAELPKASPVDVLPRGRPVAVWLGAEAAEDAPNPKPVFG